MRQSNSGGEETNKENLYLGTATLNYEGSPSTHIYGTSEHCDKGDTRKFLVTLFLPPGNVTARMAR